MGHIRLGVLPRSKLWREVVALIEGGAFLETVAEASAKAAKSALSKATSDPQFLYAATLLVELPLLARSPKFLEGLRDHTIQDASSVPALLAGITDAIDRRAYDFGGRSDLGEMAQMALVESLSAEFDKSLPSLFEPTSADVRRALGQLASGNRFAGLAREFFARLVYKSLDYYLSRELANHVGTGKRFASDADRVAFDRALSQHAFEASRIVLEYAGGWYGKAVWQGDGLSEEKIKRFAGYAFSKLSSELGRRSDAA